MRRWEESVPRYFADLAVAVTLCIVSHSIEWWLSCIVFPVSIRLLMSSAHPHPATLSVRKVHTMRGAFYLLALCYIVAQTIIFQAHVGSWFGWLLGLVIGWIGGGMCAAELEPWLLWRQPVSDLYFFMCRLEYYALQRHPLPAHMIDEPVESDCVRED